MTKLTRLLLVALAVGLAVPGAALGKGITEATITGPGLGDGLTLRGEGQPGGEELMQIADSTGFFIATFGSYPLALEDARPKGDLGPRYTIEYTMPGPNDQMAVIAQQLYPYAKPTPVTYMAPQQPFFTVDRTVGGWYLATELLKSQLVAVGLPETPPSDEPGDGGARWIPIGAILLAAGLGAVTALALRSRRRAGPAPA